jgi:hypothetical protein
MQVLKANSGDLKGILDLSKQVQTWHHQLYPEIFKEFDHDLFEEGFFESLDFVVYNEKRMRRIY